MSKEVVKKLYRGLRGRKADGYFTYYTSKDNRLILGLSSGDDIAATTELNGKDVTHLIELLEHYKEDSAND